ncbi:MAG: FecR family protein [Pseudomonadota bacterium]
MTGATDRQDQIEEDAALWVARLGEGPLDAGMHRRLEQWLADDPRHAAAFAEAQAAWGLMEEVAHVPGRLADDRPPPRRRRPAQWRPLAALAASLLVLVTGAVLWTGDLLPLVAADYRTAPGERRTVTLTDGSVVQLGPHSAIALRFDGRERRIELIQGLAYFVAAPRRGAEETRPFVVHAGAGTARALGTQFEVHRFSDSVEVTVIEHDVAVALTGGGEEAADVVLSPGQSVRYAAAGIGPVRTTNLEHALAWRRDRLIFDRVPLAQVVDELNLYRRGRIVVATSELAARHVSGVFDMSDADGALSIIARELDARTVSAPLLTILY